MRGTLGILRSVTKTVRCKKKAQNSRRLIYIIITSRLSKQNHLSRANDHPERDYIHCLFKETFRRVFTIMSNPRVCCMVVYSSTRLYRLVTD